MVAGVDNFSGGNPELFKTFHGKLVEGSRALFLPPIGIKPTLLYVYSTTCFPASSAAHLVRRGRVANGF